MLIIGSKWKYKHLLHAALLQILAWNCNIFPTMSHRSHWSLWSHRSHRSSPAFTLIFVITFSSGMKSACHSLFLSRHISVTISSSSPLSDYLKWTWKLKDSSSHPRQRQNIRNRIRGNWNRKILGPPMCIWEPVHIIELFLKRNCSNEWV